MTSKDKETEIQTLKEMLAACVVRESHAPQVTKEACSAFLRGFAQGSAAGYRLGYSAGLFALEPQVPFTVHSMWKAASVEARERHFKEDLTWLNIQVAEKHARQGGEM